MILQSEDLQKLLREPGGAGKIEVAEKVASGFAAGEFSAAERKVALEIFRLLVKDAEIQVRMMLSFHLASSFDTPHDIAYDLASDVSDVATPMLERSYVLTEEDLIAITDCTKDVKVMLAIARRETVSRELSLALLNKSNIAVIETLLHNKSASINDESLSAVMESNLQNPSILELMVKRGGLSVALAERLFVAVSDEMKNVLTSHYKLSLQIADSSTKDAREMATLGLLDADVPTMNIARLVDQLYQEGRLTLSMIIRSLCLGDMRFFEHAMAALSDVPLANVQLLLLDQGTTGFEALYRTSCLPMEMFSAISYLLKVTLAETSFGRYQRNDFKKRLAHRLLQDDAARKIDYMDYILTLIQHNARDVASAYQA